MLAPLVPTTEPPDGGVTSGHNTGERREGGGREGVEGGREGGREGGSTVVITHCAPPPIVVDLDTTFIVVPPSYQSLRDGCG